GRIIVEFAGRNIPNSCNSQHRILTLSASVASYDPANPEVYGGWSKLVDDAVLHLHIAQGQGGNMVGKPLPGDLHLS
ncbi:MAG TPA: hypothetical protein VGL10_03135, partial [Gammaproteobacteria bacterium]